MFVTGEKEIIVPTSRIRNEQRYLPFLSPRRKQKAKKPNSPQHNKKKQEVGVGALLVVVVIVVGGGGVILSHKTLNQSPILIRLITATAYFLDTENDTTKQQQQNHACHYRNQTQSSSIIGINININIDIHGGIYCCDHNVVIVVGFGV